MKKLITLNFSLILPGENGFWLENLNSVIEREENGIKHLPVPIRRANLFYGSYYNLEGRHRMIYAKMRGLNEAEFFLTEHPEKDIYKEKDFPKIPMRYLIDSNYLIATRWAHVSTSYRRIGVENFNEFFEITAGNFPFMQTVETFKKFVAENPWVLNQGCRDIRIPTLK